MACSKQLLAMADCRWDAPSPSSSSRQSSATAADAGPTNTSVYIQGLPTHVPSGDLERALFVLCSTIGINGTARKVKVYCHKGTAVVKGDALVTFSDQQSAQRAASELHGKEIHPLCKMSATMADFSKSVDNKLTKTANSNRLSNSEAEPTAEQASGTLL